jgi:uncharacterized NAD-dependent epimerase/dehydratase family protein
VDGTALLYCEGAFGTLDGKTAHGLVRSTERYRVLGVIDSSLSGRDAGDVLDGTPTGVPIFAEVGEAVDSVDGPIHFLVIALAPDGGRLGPKHRVDVRRALELSLNVDSGLHEFLSEDEELAGLAASRGVRIRDVRRPPVAEELHFFTGKIAEVRSPRVAVLGTDSAVGKRTTTLLTERALNAVDIKAVMIGTGQTAWLQGVRHGLCLDALPTDFVTGELEHAVHRAFCEERPDVILVEGQGSLFHPAFASGIAIIAATRPEALVLQHAPARSAYAGFPQYPIVDLGRQIQTLELLAGAPVLAITVNHEGIATRDMPAVLRDLEARHERPAIAPLGDGLPRLVETIRSQFNELADRTAAPTGGGGARRPTDL